jgi:phosphonate transport system substrate-binding protein
MKQLTWLFVLMFCLACGKPASNVLRVGISAIESDADVVKRYEPLRAYLEKRLSRPVELRTATDYAAVIEALKSRQVDVAYFGAAAYARAWLVTQGQVKPLLATLNEDGENGYHSIIVVPTNSPAQRIEDLRGKRIAFADPNSTSGYLAPSFFLTEQGIETRTFFSKTGFGGSHETSVVAMLNGTYDAAATWFYSDNRTNPLRMEGKGIIPKGSTRIIWKSPRIPSSPWTVRTDSPEEFNKLFAAAVMEFPKQDPQAFQFLSAQRESGYSPVEHSAYEPVIRMVRSNLEQRKQP